MVPAIKGVSVHDVMLFTQHRFGSKGWTDLVATLPESDQQTMSSIVSVGWYELALYARLLRQLANVHGQGSLRLVEECGRFGVEHDLKTIHKLFMRAANPGFILDQAIKLWGRFQNSGQWEIERKSNGCVGTLRGWGADEVLCSELTGYLAGLLGLSCDTVRLTHPKCRARGADDCVFVSTWR